ncbi:uncharacterized protein C6orf118 homolog isoform X2 [Ambystoma mexicanum]|uniref:uncharacterized protein C6orf118 homolog isoform X2 n=1 Tax=Ambystoma mexicanum TaxID=8296 RepID=UPI0037E9B88D
MQEGKLKKKLPLKNILDNLEKGNKAEVLDYTRGHLNHTHLFNPQAFARKSFWESLRAPTKSNIETRHQKLAEVKIQRMKDAWSDFTIKTSIVPGSSRVRSSEFSSLDPKCSTFGPNTPMNTTFIGSSNKALKSKTSTEWESITPTRPFCREELAPSDVKLIKFKPVKNRRTALQDQKGECTFVPVYLSGLTKRDQMDMLVQFNKEYVKKQDLLVSNDYNKNTTVEHIENKMAQELLKIRDTASPNYKRLQIISASFEDLGNESVVFGKLFLQIKKVYDAYLDSLLDSHPEQQYEILLKQMKTMRTRPVMSSDLLQAKEDVTKLEKEAIAALEKNEQLRNELESISKSETAALEIEEKDILEEPEEKHHPQSLAEQFEMKRHQVLTAWRDVQELEQKIKEHMVHATDVHAVERYIQDTKAETTTLDASNSLLQKACQNLESDIEKALAEQTINPNEKKEVQSLLNTFLSP